MYAYATCETVNKSSKSKNICYIDSTSNICYICKSDELSPRGKGADITRYHTGWVQSASGLFYVRYARRATAVLARAGIRRATVIERLCCEMSEVSR